MLGGLFDMDKPFWRWIGKVPEMVGLSFLWLLCSLPIITIIPASCALFDAVSRNLMVEQKGCFQRFFRSFVRELKQGIPLTIIWLIIAFISIMGDRIITYYSAAVPAFSVFSVIYRIMIIMMVGYLLWLVPLQSRYNHSIISLHVNALRFFLGRLPHSILMLLISAVLIIVGTINYFTTCFLIVIPCLISVFQSLFVEKAFMKVFPNDYEDGHLVCNEEERDAVKAIKEAKNQEQKNAEEGY